MKGFQTYPSLTRKNRARKMHRTDEISALFKKMDIGLKLKLNFKIDKENRKQREKSLEFQLGNSTDDALDIASFVTIDTISLDNVRKDPTTFERLKDFLTTDTLDFFRQRNEEEEGDRRSRTRGKEEEAEEEIAKWVKEAGGIFRDEDLDFIQWSQAAKNFYQFKCLRDKDLGKEAPQPLFYVEHFAFFLNQQDSEDFFTYWLKVEVKLRKEHQSKLYAFDSNTYEREWTLVHVPASQMPSTQHLPLPLLPPSPCLPKRRHLQRVKSPFQQAARREPRPLAASDVPPAVTSSTDMTIRRTDHSAGLETSKDSLARLQVRTSAGTGTSEDNAEAVTRNTAARSVAAPVICMQFTPYASRPGPERPDFGLITL
ncbi:hypothetical protein F5877DRAFT_72725 [Lentinula edodes]|nr:hypothetical protein F5877DRAFT_72725 [Lentinula edodes]